MDRHQISLCQGWPGQFLMLYVALIIASPFLAMPGLADDPPLSVNAQAGAAQLGSKETDERIGQWIVELSSGEYATRRNAFMELWKQGPAALSAVRNALNASDQQTISSAKMLENLLRLGIAPSENGDLTELLQLSASNWEATLRSVAQKGHWRLAADVMRNHPNLLQNIRESYSPDRFCRLVQIAFEQGDAYQSWPVVALGLSPERRFYLTEITRKQLQQYYKDKIPEDIESLLNVAGDEKTLEVDDRALLYLFSGRVQEAWNLNPSARVKQRIIFHSAKWEWLKDPAVASLSVAAGNNSLLRRARLAAYSRLSGDDAKCNEIVAELRQELEKSRADMDKNSHAGSIRDIIKALIVCGEGQFVNEIIERYNVTVDVDYHTYLLQHDKVFSSFGLEKNLNNFDEWLVELPGKLNPNGPQAVGSAIRFAGYLELTRFLVHTGFPEQARKLYTALITASRRLSVRESLEKWNELLTNSTDHQIRQFLLEYLDENDSTLKPEERRLILARVFSDWENTVEKLYQHVPAELSQVDGKAKRWSLLDRLWKYDRTLVQNEAAVQQIEKWLTTAVREASKGEETMDQAVGELATVALRLGLRKQALNMVRSETTRNILADMAEMLTANNSFEAAGKWWESAIGQLPDQHMWIRRYADVLLMQGEAEIAAKYESSIWLRPLGNHQLQTSDITYAIIAEKYYDAGSFDLAQQYSEAAVALGDPGEQGWRGRRMASIAIEREDYKTAARGNRIYILNLLMSPGNIARTPLDAIQYFQYFAGQDLLSAAANDIQAGQFNSAMSNISKFESILPSGIEICEHCYPLLVKAGKQKEADELLERCNARMLTHLKAWPNDSNAHNNLAWMLARCNVYIPEALEHATKAVELSHRAPTYVDTLAEAEYRAGHLDRAIELASECIESDPRHAHYQIQLQRFRELATPRR